MRSKLKSIRQLAELSKKCSCVSACVSEKILRAKRFGSTRRIKGHRG